MGGSSKSILLPFNMPPVAKGGMLGFLSGGGGGSFTGAPFYEIIGRTSLGSAADNINVTFTGKDNIMVLSSLLNDGQIQPQSQLGGDSGSNYAYRQSFNSGSDSTATGQTFLTNYDGNVSSPWFNVEFIVNDGSEEKLLYGLGNNRESAGASTAPHRMENIGKWADESAQFSSYRVTNGRGGDYDTNSEVVVLGYDNDSTAGSDDSAWELLSETVLSGSATSISSGTIESKKYLWFELSTLNSAIAYQYMRFNNTGATSQYATRKSANGGTDSTNTSQPQIDIYVASTSQSYVRGWIMNIADKEKLVIFDNVGGATGSGNVPDYRQGVGKWDSTSAAITRIDVFQGNGSEVFLAGTTLKIWGFS